MRVTAWEFFQAPPQLVMALLAGQTSWNDMTASILLAMGKVTVEEAHELLAANEQRIGVSKAREEPLGNALVALRQPAEQRRAAGSGAGGTYVASSVTRRGT